MKKFKLGPKETFAHGGTFVRVHRLTALTDIPAHNVKAGDIGGWVESRKTLSHEGDCWIGGNAVVADSCRVREDALVTGNASVTGSCTVSGKSVVKGDACLSGLIRVRDNAVVSDKAAISSPCYVMDGGGYTSDGAGYKITENAQIMGAPKIKGHGSIRDNSIVKDTPEIVNIEMSGTSIIAGNPVIHNCILEGSAQIFDSAEVWSAILKGKAKVYGQASIHKGNYYTLLTDNVKVFGNARISGSNEKPATTFSEDTNIYDNAIVRENCQISGTTVINDVAHLLEYCNISGNSRVSGPAPLPPRYTAKDMIQDISGIQMRRGGLTNLTGRINTNPVSSSQKTNANYLGAYTSSPISSALRKRSSAPVAQPVETKSIEVKSIEPIRLELAEIVAKVETDYDAYKNDVVKLIKYPTMVDLKDELTLNLTFALRKAKREVSYGQNPEKMEESVETLERAFLAAEANAQKIGASNYSDHEIKKTETAKQMLAVALDEEASENERRVSFKQAFKILEGIIAVPDAAVENMKLKVGLKELEA